MLERYCVIAKTHWKHNLFSHCIIAVLLCVAAPLIMGVRNLEEAQVAKIIEFYLGFLGVILFIPLFLPDTNKDIRDVIASKKMSITTVRIIRLFGALLILGILLLLFLGALKRGNCNFHYGRCFYAAAANGVFMGGLGLFFYSIVDNIALAYMIPVFYYIVSMGSGRKYLGKFYLMGFSAGSIEEKKYILAAGIFMIAAALIIRSKRRT